MHPPWLCRARGGGGGGGGGRHEGDRPLAELRVRHRDNRGFLSRRADGAQRLFHIARIPGAPRHLDQLGEASAHGDITVAVDGAGISVCSQPPRSASAVFSGLDPNSPA